MSDLEKYWILIYPLKITHVMPFLMIWLLKNCNTNAPFFSFGGSTFEKVLVNKKYQHCHFPEFDHCKKNSVGLSVCRTFDSFYIVVIWVSDYWRLFCSCRTIDVSDFWLSDYVRYDYWRSAEQSSSIVSHFIKKDAT